MLTCHIYASYLQIRAESHRRAHPDLDRRHPAVLARWAAFVDERPSFRFEVTVNGTCVTLGRVIALALLAAT